MRGAKTDLKIKAFLCFLAILLTVSSCATTGDEKKELEKSLSAVTEAEYTAHITASFPSKEAKYTISYTHSPEKDRACVLAPDEVAGVSYSVSGESGYLEFDGALLEIGKLSDCGISPFSCIHSLLNSWKSGSFGEITNDTMHGKTAYLVISKEKKDLSEIEYRSWFSKDGFLPLYAEIFSDGERIIMCEFERAEHKTK